MKSRPTQFGVRKNPDSPRVHGLRPSVNPPLTSIKEFVGSHDEENVSSTPSCKIGGLDVPPAGVAREITVEKEKRLHRLVPAVSCLPRQCQPNHLGPQKVLAREGNCCSSKARTDSNSC
jgi:hypothetical protein